MSDIKLPERFVPITDQECYTSMNSSFQYFTKAADCINYLNAYMKPVIPMRVYADEQSATTFHMPFPVSKVGPQQRYAIVCVGISRFLLAAVALPTLTVSTVSHSKTVNLGRSPATGTGTPPVGGADVEDGDMLIDYHFVRIPLSTFAGGQTDLISASVVAGTAWISAFGAWELPEGTSETSAGGGIQIGKANALSSVPGFVDPAQFYPGKSVTLTETDAVFDNYVTFGNPGRVFWASGWAPNPAVSLPQESVWTGSGDLPHLGIRFPPYQAHDNSAYVNIKGMIWATAAAGNVSLYSESLNYAGPSVAMTTADRYYPGTHTAASYVVNTNALAGEADPNGDWIFLRTDNANTEITQCILWIDDELYYP